MLLGLNVGTKHVLIEDVNLRNFGNLTTVLFGPSVGTKHLLTGGYGVHQRGKKKKQTPDRQTMARGNSKHV